MQKGNLLQFINKQLHDGNLVNYTHEKEVMPILHAIKYLQHNFLKCYFLINCILYLNIKLEFLIRCLRKNISKGEKLNHLINNFIHLIKFSFLYKSDL